MTKTLQDATRPILCSETKLFSNNLDIIRLCLAVAVIFSHSYPLTLGGAQSGREWFIRTLHTSNSAGALAVDFFFVISGFLITMSWLRSRSMQDFLRRRLLRIYPGYIVATVASLLIAVAGVFPHVLPYLHSVRPRGFVRDLLVPGYGVINTLQAFPSNPYPHVVNGSVWTIYYEVQCYLLTAVIGLFGLFRFRHLGLTAFAVLFCWYAVRLIHHANLLQEEIRFFVFYLAGMQFYLYRDKIPATRALFFVMLGILALGCIFQPLFLIALPLAGSYLLFYLAFSPRIRLQNFAHHTDLSYGTYLYAFPIQQLLESWFHFAAPGALFAATLPITLLCAALSWHYVEKPCLALKQKRIVDFDPALAAQPAPSA